MVSTSITDLPALAQWGRTPDRLPLDHISLAPLWRVVIVLIALSLPVLGSAVANRFPGDGASSAVGALAVSHSPLGGTARMPDVRFTTGVAAR